jgi:hypothetical protein
MLPAASRRRRYGITKENSKPDGDFADASRADQPGKGIGMLIFACGTVISSGRAKFCDCPCAAAK